MSDPKHLKVLDVAVIVFAFCNLTLFGAVLALRDIPQANLPILASLGTGLLGIITAYAVWRFKTKVDPAAPVTTEPANVVVTHTVGQA